MTKEQIDERTPEVQANKKIESELGLDELFSKWLDHKTGAELLYFGIVNAERIEADETGKKKIVSEKYVSIRYVAGKQVMFSLAVWAMKTKDPKGVIIQRFQKL